MWTVASLCRGRPGERPLLGLTDGNGINLFDPLNGDRVACGDLRNSPPNGPLPTISFEHDTSGWFVFLRDQIIRLGLADGDEEDCPSRRIITSEWFSPVVDGLQLNGSRLILSANGDGPTILTSVWRSDVQSWSVDTFTTDGQNTLHQNARLLHASETPTGFSLLVLEDPDRSGELGRDGCVHLSVSQNGEVLSRSRLGAHCEVIRSPRDPYRSREFHGPTVLQIGGETLWFARVFDALEHVGEATSHLARFGDDGSVERLDVGRPIRAVVAGCSQVPCRINGDLVALGLVSDDGFIAITSQDGRTLNVSRNPPPGCSATFGCVGGHRLWCRHILLFRE